MDLKFFASGQRMEPLLHRPYSIGAVDRVISRTNKAEWIGIARLLPSGLRQEVEKSKETLQQISAKMEKMEEQMNELAKLLEKVIQQQGDKTESPSTPMVRISEDP